jgi:hypothetical protein
MSTNFKRKFTSIKDVGNVKGVSAIRRLPWKGRIGLGVQVPTIEKDSKGNYKKDEKGVLIQARDKFGKLVFHPKDVPYFIVPKEVKTVYGDQPTELDIIFPLSCLDENGQPDLGGIFPQALKLYGSGRGLKCTGDGEVAMMANDEGVFEEVECPCERFGEKDGCGKVGTLLFFLPDVAMGGVYAIDSGSWHSMVDVQSGIALAQELLRNPYTGEYNSISMLPFKLRRVEKEIQHDKRKDKHWPLTCELDLSVEQIKEIRERKTLMTVQRRLYQIEDRPEEVNPRLLTEAEGTVIERLDQGSEKTIEETGGKADVEGSTYRKPSKAAIEEHTRRKVEEGKIKAKELKDRIDKKKEEEKKSEIRPYKEAKEIARKKEEENRKAIAEEEAKKVALADMSSIENQKKLKEKLDKLVNAGIVGWKYIQYYACLADIVDPGVPLEDLQRMLCEHDEYTDRIIAKYKSKLEEL